MTTTAAMWVLWCGAFLASFLILEGAGLAAKRRGDPDARTLTDLLKEWFRSWTLRILLGLFFVWLWLHIVGAWGL